MAVRIADTLGRLGSGNFPLAYSTDVQVSTTDKRTVSDALTEAGSIATKTSRGVVQVGDGIDVTDSTDANPGTISLTPATDTQLGGVKIGDGIESDEGVISVPFYAAVGSSEPEDKNMLWIDTSAVYNPTGEEIPISQEANNAIEVKEDGLYVGTNNIYGEEEIVCGQWFDKPLYRIVNTTGKFPYANYGEIPTITGDDSRVLYSTQYNTSYAWKAFDKDSTTNWCASSSSGYIGWDFEKEVVPVVLTVQNVLYSGAPKATTIILQGSNDKSTWNDIHTYKYGTDYNATADPIEFKIEESVLYRYLRVYLTGEYWVELYELNIEYGEKDLTPISSTKTLDGHYILEYTKITD